MLKKFGTPSTFQNEVRDRTFGRRSPWSQRVAFSRPMTVEEKLIGRGVTGQSGRDQTV